MHLISMKTPFLMMSLCEASVVYARLEFLCVEESRLDAFVGKSVQSIDSLPNKHHVSQNVATIDSDNMIAQKFEDSQNHAAWIPKFVHDLEVTAVRSWLKYSKSIFH